MHIDKVVINVHAPQVAPFTAFLGALMGTADIPATQAPEPQPSTATALLVAPPAIGEIWAGHGGIYGGIVRGFDGERDAHIVVSTIKPEGDLNWQAALDWAKTVETDGHRDFALPTRFQAPILYGNLRDHFEQSGWHWTSTEYSERYAWLQNFNLGDQYDDAKSYEARARAVRFIPFGA